MPIPKKSFSFERSDLVVDSGNGYLTVRDYKTPEGIMDAQEIDELVYDLLTPVVPK